jgi:hypothetical protein
MTTHNTSEKGNLSLSGIREELSLDQLEGLSGGAAPLNASFLSLPVAAVIVTAVVGFAVGTAISKAPPVRSKLELAGDAIGTWLGNNGIWW